MPTTMSSSAPVRSAPSASDLEALEREIANVQEERRLLLGRLDELRAARDEPASSSFATYATYAFSFVAIVGFVVIVALNPPRVPPVKILVPGSSASHGGEVRPTETRVAEATQGSSDTPVGRTPTGPRTRGERGSAGATSGARVGARDVRAHPQADRLLHGIEDGDDPLGDLASPRRPRTHVDDPIDGLD